MYMNVHTCAHTLLCTQPVHHIFVTHTAHTHTVHLHCYRNGILCTTHTYNSCTVHLYARILMNNIKHVYTRSHTHMYIARKVYSKLVLCTLTCNINSFNCFMHVFDFYTLSLCSLRVEIPCGWFSVHRHSHHRSRRWEEMKLSYWAQPLLIYFLFAMLSFVPLA